MNNTMTVKELMEALKQYPDDMPVFAEWEGVNAYIDRDMISVECISKQPSFTGNALLINVDNY